MGQGDILLWRCQSDQSSHWELLFFLLFPLLFLPLCDLVHPQGVGCEAAALEGPLGTGTGPSPQHRVRAPQIPPRWDQRRLSPARLSLGTTRGSDAPQGVVMCFGDVLVTQRLGTEPNQQTAPLPSFSFGVFAPLSSQNAYHGVFCSAFLQKSCLASLSVLPWAPSDRRHVPEPLPPHPCCKQGLFVPITPPKIQHPNAHPALQTQFFGTERRF